MELIIYNQLLVNILDIEVNYEEYNKKYKYKDMECEMICLSMYISINKFYYYILILYMSEFMVSIIILYNFV